MDHKDLQIEIEAADDSIRRGGLVIVPTETVYGLAACATNASAVAHIYKIKARPASNPLPLLVADLIAAREFAHISPMAETLAAAFWPGPLTLVLPLKDGTGLAAGVTGGKDSIALRVPDHPVIQQLLQCVKAPMVLTSANFSGKPSPTRVDMIDSKIKAAVEVILDGGPCSFAQESTILKIAGDHVTLLRQGALGVQEIESALGMPLDITHD